MRVERPRGHEELVGGLWRAAARGRLPHALLFEGPDGIGKYQAAKWLAQGLLCAGGPGEPCGECGPCRRVLSGGETSNHPDLFSIDPIELELENIIVGLISERQDGPPSAEAFLRLKASEAGWRVVLIREAQRLNAQAQNALLKTLEEPSAGTLLVLETAMPQRLLSTILSRCVRVRLRPLGAEQAREVAEGQGLEPREAAELVRWSAGSPGGACRLAQQGAQGVRELVVEVLTDRIGPLEAARGVWELEGEFGGKTPLARQRNRARAALELCLAVLGDGGRVLAGREAEALRHGDLAELCAGLAGRGGSAWVEERLERLLVARQDIESNVAPEAILDRAFLALAAV